jgi:hypothetical protein
MHQSLKRDAAAFLRAKRYAVKMEYVYRLSGPIRIGERMSECLRIDVAGLRKGKPVIAIECGECSSAKLEFLKTIFNEVWHWNFNGSRRRI